MCFACIALRVDQGRIEPLTYFSAEIFAELERGVVVGDRLLDSRYCDMWQVAQTVLSCAAEEVAVSSAASFGFCVDKPRSPTMFVTTLAEQESFEVMRQNAVSLSAAASRTQDFLNAVKQILADDGFVSSGVDVALVDHEPRVVRVTQHPVKLRF
ncbi:hypothetical protein [Mycobacteroides abscessus]|uniref:hypothetical protein n=1 Tax=Mycobacteroides abscessus TaxID=36809 RepID=UPI00387DC901